MVALTRHEKAVDVGLSANRHSLLARRRPEQVRQASRAVLRNIVTRHDILAAHSRRHRAVGVQLRRKGVLLLRPEALELSETTHRPLSFHTTS
jgi:hypothetical protein